MKKKFPVEESLRTSDSFSAIRDRVASAIMMNVRAGIDMDCDGDGMDDCNDYAWVQDIYPSSVIYCMGGKMFQCEYKVDKRTDNIALGSPSEVETVYKGVDESQAPLRRVLAVGATSFREAAYDAPTGKLTIRVIEAGFNKSKQRFYPAETLKRDHQIFAGAKMFADHQTEAEQKTRPEGSVNDWVANVQKVWAESNGTVMAEAVVIDPAFKQKLATLNEQHLLHEMGVSIRAIGEARQKEVDGVTTSYVESLLQARSVDFVTYAGAGGQVEAMEADSNKNNQLDLDLVDESQLRKHRPDLVTLIESTASKDNMKTLEQQLTEYKEANTKLEAENTNLQAKLTESETKNQKIAVASELKNLLAESKLPEPAKLRITDRFKDALKMDGIKEAITAEVDYIKQVGGNAAVVPVRKNLGAQHNDGAVDTREADKGKSPENKTRLEEAFAGIGLNKKESEIAASR